MSAAHEDLARTRPIEGSSERSFGLVAAAAFLVLAGWPLHYGAMPRWWALGAAALFALAAFAPIGVLMRLCGKDPLRLRRDPDARSHWIARRPPGPPPDSMTHQF
jgi:hypothetical protein